ncbi:6065_t:CDS:2, partial [Funneliformis geosporum]
MTVQLSPLVLNVNTHWHSNLFSQDNYIIGLLKKRVYGVEEVQAKENLTLKATYLLINANNAGGRIAEDCTLILTEGESLAVSGLDVKIMEFSYFGKTYKYSEALDFIGSNYINILYGKGQFGTKAQGGKDAAISVAIPGLTRKIFHPHDDHRTLKGKNKLKVTYNTIDGSHPENKQMKIVRIGFSIRADFEKAISMKITQLG